MSRQHFSVSLTLLSLVLFLLLPVASFAQEKDQQITCPEEFFGFQMGADRKLARWDKLVEYYNLLATQSPRLKVTLGESTLRQPLPGFIHFFCHEPGQTG